MTLISKAVLVAAGAATVIGSTPAFARDRHRDGIDAGDVIAGALIIGGIAAIASAASSDKRGRYDDRDYNRGHGYYDRGGYGSYDRGYDSRWAVNQCVRAAQRDASRYGRVRVTDVTRIDRVRGGYEIRGRLVVEDRGYDRRGYGNGWDRYGHNYDRYNDGYDKGRFTCVTRYDRVAGLRVSGLG